MPKFRFYNGKLRSEESIAYLEAIERGDEPQRPADSIQAPLELTVQLVPGSGAAEDGEVIPLTPAQKRAATIARKRLEAERAEPLRPKNIDPSTGKEVVLKEVKDPATGEVSQVPVEGLGEGTPVDEEPELPSGDERVEGITSSDVANTLNAISAENAEASEAIALATAPNQGGE